MARIARIVAPHIPLHVTQRGNRRQTTFFKQQDYQEYLRLLSEWCGKCQVEIWAYCLMPNHVHLILVPVSEDGLSKAISETHCRYTRYINFREGWRGHLWQGRFSSYPMDQSYLLAAARYVELNPVHAKLVVKAEDWQWSSAAAHLRGTDDGIVLTRKLLDIVPRWGEFLAMGQNSKEYIDIERYQRTGRPAGGEEFVRQLESLMGRVLRKSKPGPKPRMAFRR
jgi:putative transposase